MQGLGTTYALHGSGAGAPDRLDSLQRPFPDHP